MNSNYEALATALCGRPLRVVLSEEGTPAYASTTTIYVPVQLPLLQQHHIVIAQALLLREGAFGPVFIAQLIARKQSRPRFMMAEIIRLSHAYPWLVPRNFLRLDAIKAASHIPVDRESSLKLALSRKKIPSSDNYFGVFKPYAHISAAMDGRFNNEAMNNSFDAKQQTIHDAAEANKDEVEDGEASRLLELLSNSNSQGGLTQSLFEKIFGGGGGKQKDTVEGSGAELEIGRVEATDKKGRFAKLADLMGLSGAKPQYESVNDAFHYPEWDVTKSQYRSDWACVHELEPWNDEPPALKQTLRGASRQLLRQLSGIGLDYEWHAGEEQGDELIIDKLVDVRIAAATGNHIDPNVYRAARRTARDLGVMILLDVSGSVAETDGAGDSVHFKQCQLAYELLDGFIQVGDQAALYGFHSWGRKLVRLLRVKSFKERLSSQVLERFEQLEPGAYTRMGAALRHAAKLLLEETRLPHRLLIVVSDGFPYDDGYEGAYAEADTAKAVTEIREQGTACLCLSIGSSTDANQLKAVFGGASVLSVAKEADFLANIRQFLINALQTTSA